MRTLDFTPSLSRAHDRQLSTALDRVCSEWLDARAEAFRDFHGTEVTEALYPIADSIAELASRGDAAKLGAVVCAVIDAHLDGMADKEVFGKSRAPSAANVALQVLMGQA
jgi:hypothetical protein